MSYVIALKVKAFGKVYFNGTGFCSFPSAKIFNDMQSANEFMGQASKINVLGAEGVPGIIDTKEVPYEHQPSTFKDENGVPYENGVYQKFEAMLEFSNTEYAQKSIASKKRLSFLIYTKEEADFCAYFKIKSNLNRFLIHSLGGSLDGYINGLIKKKGRSFYFKAFDNKEHLITFRGVEYYIYLIEAKKDYGSK